MEFTSPVCALLHSGNEQAEIISPIISDYNIPEVMADVSTSMVSRGSKTPYFTRAAPSDEVFYSAISNVLQSLGWKYVQVRFLFLPFSQAQLEHEVGVGG